MLNLQPYADPQYFLLLMLGLLPVMIGLYHGHRFKTYETLISLLFIILMFTGAKWQQGIALIGYILWQLAIVFGYLHYRKHHNQTSVFVITVLLSILPLVIVKVTPAVVLHPSLLGFLGISYLTFKAVQVIMELRDGTMKAVG